ncbi:MAG: FG-GAP-like repeat-containing protein, partial [Candidatus Omnitrophota bacterium]
MKIKFFISVFTLVLFLSYNNLSFAEQENTNTETESSQESQTEKTQGEQASSETEPIEDSQERTIITSGEPPYASTEKFQVEPSTGTATLTIPIEVSPGRKGIQPNLALMYNSSAPNGILGVGWNLELGSIQRSTKKGVPKYDNTDTFVLAQAGSAQELVSIGGSQYRAKIEGAFMRLEYNGSYGWIVTDKKGIKYYFGQNSASQQVDSGRIFKWCLDEVKDLNDNYMRITYYKDQNQIYPELIEYTGNVSESPFASVEFVLGSRSDTTKSYATGFLVQNFKRISAIEVKVDGQLQRKYTFNYTNSVYAQHSLLASITQYDSTATNSLPPTVLTYSQNVLSFNDPVNIANSPAYLASDSKIRFLDMNGDGLVDAMYGQDYSPSHPYYQLWINDGQGGFQPQQNMPSSPVYSPDNQYMRFLDMTGDGFPDALYAEPNGYILWKNNGNGGFSAQYNIPNSPAYGANNPKVRFLDMNGDGLPDVLYGEGGGWTSYVVWINDGNGGFHTGTGMPGSPVYPADNGYMRFLDMTGDNLPDVLYAEPNGYILWRTNNNGTFTRIPAGIMLNSPDYGGNDPKVRFLDMNGDGLTDVLYANESHDNRYRFWLNNGDYGFEPAIFMNNYPPYSGDRSDIRFFDMNADGQVDVVWAEANGYQLWLNKADGTSYSFQGPINLANDPDCSASDFNTLLMDTNGDGMIDILYGASGNYRVWNNLTDSYSAKPELLISISNSIGADTSINYDRTKVIPLPPMQYMNAYTPTLFHTAEKIISNDGQGNFYIATYDYKNGLYDFSDREFRGFGWVKITDAQENYAETDFLQDAIYKGRISQQRSYDAGGNLFTKVANDWSYQDLNNGSNFVYLSKTDNYVFDGNPSGKRTQAQYFYEENPQYGNLTRTLELGEVAIDSGDDLDSSDNRSSFVEYACNTELWILALPKHVYLQDYQGNKKSEKWFYYDYHTGLDDLPIKGLLTKQEDWFDGGNNPTATFSYDSYGNLLTTTDALGRTSTVTYDSTYHMFPLVTENVLGHQAINEYYGVDGVPLDDGVGFHGLWGQTKSTTDPNGNTGYSVYDAFGRTEKQISSEDSIDYPTISYEYDLTSIPNKVISHQREVSGQPGTSDSVSFYDGLGRLIQTKTESEDPGKFIVSGQTEYNLRGLPEKKYLPFFDSTYTFSDVVPITQNPYLPSTIDYDPMGRVIRATNPDTTYS